MCPEPIQQVIESLANSPDLIISLVRESPDDLLKRRPDPDRWSAHEHACHLAAVEPMLADRMQQMMEQDHPTLRPYQPDREYQPDELLAVDLEGALERYRRQRAELVMRLRTLSPERWARTAEHPEYRRYSLFILFRHVVMHDMFHGYRIEELLLEKD